MWKLIKWVLSSLLFLVLVLAGLGFYVWHGIYQEPAFYRELAITPETREFAELNSGLMSAKISRCDKAMQRKGSWEIELTQNELNHWLAIEIDEKRPGAISRRIQGVRCQLVADVVRIGARVDVDEFQGVVSVDVVPTVEAPNVLVMELRRIRVGTIPLPRKRLLTLLEEKARELSIPFECLESNGNPSIRIAFSDGELRRGYHSLVLHKILLGAESVSVAGETLE